MNKKICWLLLMLLVAQFAAAQETTSSSGPVVNKDILEMVRAGMSADVVIAKIKNSACKFDTSPSALVSLKEAGIADEILMEMVRNPNGTVRQSVQPSLAPKADPTPVQTSVKESANDNLPEYGDISEIRKMRRVFVIADDIDSQNMMIRGLQQYDGFMIASSPDRAEIFVAFSQGSTATSVVLRGLFPGTIDHRTKAQFIVYYKSESGRNRIVWQETEDIQTSSGLTFSRPNEVNVIRHFVKAFKKLRGE